MRKSLVVIFLALLCVIGCLGCNGRYYCYSAKLYDLQDARIIQVYWHRVRNGSGYIYAEMDGERLKGEYATQTDRGTSVSFGTGTATAYSGGKSLSAVGQSVGFAYNDSGMYYGSFVIIGDKGTSIECDYKINPNDDHGVFTGIARDNHGKTYRLMANWKEELQVPAWAQEKAK